MNSLQFESSPYLLQHRHNPVDWYAWKPEALERARRENKMILVSIGYSTCHWCHVMERESFENEDIAALMNEHFVCIKVDREERPDLDAVYMEACQILTGSGGWPLNCFLTPDARPFYAGTYFPPRPAHNRPSWPQLLIHLSKLWKEKPEVALEQAERLMGHIHRNDNIAIGDPTLLPAEFISAKTGAEKEIFERMRAQFDPHEGGFGAAPKFPSTMAIRYLLDYHLYTQDPQALEHALLSLDKMIQGGIYDQIGGGFARYSTDREWLAPHFEKMLYDNALLVSVISEAYKVVRDKENRNAWLPSGTHSAFYKQTIEETLNYIEREMTHPLGAFYAAQDADSEGVEGKFYVWSKSEIEILLGADAALFCDFYDVSEHGNWEEVNILRRLKKEAQFAAEQGLELDAFQKKMRHCREKLYSVRAKRIWPGLDDKILLSWNALMASAYADAFKALGNPSYKKSAIRNVEFLLKNFAKAENAPNLLHSWKDGKAQYDAFLDDYAFLIAALLDVYEIEFEERYLRLAEQYTQWVLDHFGDEQKALFFYTGDQQTDIVMRKKDMYDNATPSGNSSMAHNLRRLAILLDHPDWRDRAHKMLSIMGNMFEKYPLSFQRWALALLYENKQPMEIAIIGPLALDWVKAIQERPIPNVVYAASLTENETLPLLASKHSGLGETLIYVCRNYACQAPLSSLDAFFKEIDGF